MSTSGNSNSMFSFFQCYLGRYVSWCSELAINPTDSSCFNRFDELNVFDTGFDVIFRDLWHIFLCRGKILQYELLSTLQISALKLHSTMGTRNHEEKNRMTTKRPSTFNNKRKHATRTKQKRKRKYNYL